MQSKQMRIIHALVFCVFIHAAPVTSAATQQLQISGKKRLSANFPCNAERVVAQTASGEAVSLQCSILLEGQFCNFIVADASLNSREFSAGGYRFIEQVHRQYALSLDPKYVPKRLAVVEYGALGKALEFEIHHNYQGHVIRAAGYWLPREDRLLRISTSCTPERPDVFRRERGIFFQSFGIVG